MVNPTKRAAKALKNVKNLSKLKQKLVHKVLDDLNVIRVLNLYARNDDSICHCIRTHKYYQTLFPNNQESQILIRTFHLWQSVAQQNRLLYADYIFDLRRPYSTFSYCQLPTLDSLMEPLQSYIAPKVFVLPIYLAICDTMALDADVLVPEVKVGPQDLDIQERRWQCMKACQEALNARKSKQLYRLANLVERYPHMLKKHLDPAVEARPNSKHIVNYFLSCAEKVKKEWCFRSGQRITSLPSWLEDVVNLPKLCCTSVFRGDGLPLVPVRKYRELFKAQLRVNPPQVDEAKSQTSRSLAYSIKSLSERWDKRRLSEKIEDIHLTQSPHKYPEDVLQDYITAIQGLYKYTYERERREYDDVYSREQEEEAKRYQRQHKFRRGHDPFSFKTPGELGYKRPRKQLPYKLYAHNDTQLDWLEAFLKTCSYMEANLPQDAEDETADLTAADTEGDMKENSSWKIWA
ncbi:hypothetical protein MMC17_005578 [Xylographa soralifera]|nr:hypothetical protein [Xylographa soralifera]